MEPRAMHYYSVLTECRGNHTVDDKFVSPHPPILSLFTDPTTDRR